MRRMLNLGLVLALTACGGGGDSGSTLPMTTVPEVLVQCNGTPKRVLVYLHSWGADATEVQQHPSIMQAPDTCIVAPNFGGMLPNDTLGKAARLEQIDAAIFQAQKTHKVKTVHMIAVSGGTLPAQEYLEVYPGRVAAASLWFPIHDLQQLYEGTQSQRLRDDLVTIIGHAPQGLSDPDYRARSPSRFGGLIDTPVWINAAVGDPMTPQAQAMEVLAHMPRGRVSTFNIPHVFGPEQAAEALRQLELL